MLNYGPLYRLISLLSRGRLRIGSHAKILYRLRFRWRAGSIQIGEKFSTRCGVVIDAQSGHIEIGNNVSLNDYTILLGHGGIKIGNDVRVAGQVLIASFDHNFEDTSQLIRKQGLSRKPVIIEDDVWIGAGAKILGGSHLSMGCVIGANSVIKGKTKPYGIYVGVPAKHIRQRGRLVEGQARLALD